MFKNHKFQFINFCNVYHREAHHNTLNINVNNDSHLIHVTKGTGSVTIDGCHKYPICRGVVIAVPQFTRYNMDINTDFKMMNFHYQLWLADGQFAEQRYQLPHVFHPDYFEICETKLIEMGKLTDDTPGNIFRKSKLAYEIVILHLSSNKLKEIPGRAVDERMSRIKNYLQSEACDHFDAGKLASLACLSKSQVNRKFRQVFGYSPQKYWEQHRFYKICSELKSSDRSIVQISEEFCFSSPFYFSRWFKKLAGCTPRDYREFLGNW